MKKPSPKDLIEFMKSKAEIGIEVMKMVTMNKQDIIEIKKQLEVQQSQLKMLAENNGLIDPIPKLKVLDQSVFDELDEKWQFAATDRNSKAFLFSRKPTADDIQWYAESIVDYEIIGTGYDASNWQNSLIERERKELTGSDLAKDYFNRGGCPRICFVGEDNDESLSDLVVAMVIGYAENTGFETSYNDFFPYAALVNAYGEKLPASRFDK